MKRVVQLSLKLPFELRMIEIAGMKFKRIGVHRNCGMQKLNQHFYPVRLCPRVKGKQWMFVQAQLRKHAFEACLTLIRHGSDCNGHTQFPPTAWRAAICLRLPEILRKFPSAQSVLYTERLQNDLHSWVERLRSGDSRALARAISAVENRAPESVPLLKALFPFSGKGRILGLTGAPGAGKSTLVDQLAHHYRRENKTLGIIAVDPTSPYTGGAILGDRIRMQDHHADPGIYIRSMATRGSLGGLARTSADVATVLDASGRDLVLVETVGVGQDEIDIVRLADITVVILVPGMGDDVQTIKAGIMEIADIFVINKSDREGADRVEREILAMQSLATRPDRWTPPVIKTVASEGKGIQELAAALAKYEAYLRKENLLLKRNIQNWRERLVEMLRDAMLEKARAELTDRRVEQYAAEIAEHKRDPYSLVEELAGKVGV